MSNELAGMRAIDMEVVFAHFIVADDVERSRRFYTDVLGGTVARSGEPTNVALANSWIVINRGGGPTDDKPTVTLAGRPRTPRGTGCLLSGCSATPARRSVEKRPRRGAG